VTVTAQRNGRWLQVEVGDDGIGIDLAAPSGVGLASMRERAEEFDGRCTVGARRGGRGTVVTARLPLAVEEVAG
jgi:signal transduction histidine kinase